MHQKEGKMGGGDKKTRNLGLFWEPTQKPNLWEGVPKLKIQPCSNDFAKETKKRPFLHSSLSFQWGWSGSKGGSQGLGTEHMVVSLIFASKGASSNFLLDFFPSARQPPICGSQGDQAVKFGHFGGCRGGGCHAEGFGGANPLA